MKIKELFNRYNDSFLILLVVLSVFLKITGGIYFIRPIINLAYPALLITTLLYNFSIITKKSSIYKPILFFLLYLMVNVIVCSPDEVFRPWQRFFFLCILLAVVSPLFQNNKMRQFRKNALQIACIISSFYAVMSFFFYFLGINMMSIEKDMEILEEYEGVGGWFSGLLAHSMLLGPVAAIASCYLLYLYLQQRKLYLLILLIACLGALLFASSRGAIIATIVSFLYVFYRLYKIDKKANRNFLYLFIFLFVTFPIWDSALDGIRFKENRGDASGIYGSRTRKFEQRLNEIESNPFVGIGFSSISQRRQITRSGAVEPGSSWLATLSMTGIIGFIFVVSFFRTGFRIKTKVDSNLLTKSLLIFWSVHMIVEGYIYAAGSSLCFLVWLVVGVSIDERIKEKRAHRLSVYQ